MAKLHLLTLPNPLTPRIRALTAKVDCGRPIVHPSIEPIWDGQAIGSRADLSTVKGLCSECRAFEPKNPDGEEVTRWWLYGVSEIPIVEEVEE